MSTTLTQSEFETFVTNGRNDIKDAYNQLKAADTSFASINDYKGSAQTAIANSWVGNYAAAVGGFERMYNALGTASKAANNTVDNDSATAGSRVAG